MDRSDGEPRIRHRRCAWRPWGTLDFTTNCRLTQHAGEERNPLASRDWYQLVFWYPCCAEHVDRLAIAHDSGASLDGYPVSTWKTANKSQRPSSSRYRRAAREGGGKLSFTH
jgi:hypothetical protein